MYACVPLLLRCTCLVLTGKRGKELCLPVSSGQQLLTVFNSIGQYWHNSIGLRNGRGARLFVLSLGPCWYILHSARICACIRTTWGWRWTKLVKLLHLEWVMNAPFTLLEGRGYLKMMNVAGVAIKTCSIVVICFLHVMHCRTKHFSRVMSYFLTQKRVQE